MDYRFTMTRRLIAVAVLCLALLLVLFFLLGLHLGRQWGEQDEKNRLAPVELPAALVPATTGAGQLPGVGTEPVQLKP